MKAFFRVFFGVIRLPRANKKIPLAEVADERAHGAARGRLAGGRRVRRAGRAVAEVPQSATQPELPFSSLASITELEEGGLYCEVLLSISKFHVLTRARSELAELKARGH